MPRNTSKDDPLLTLLGILGTGDTSKYITDQEKQGQQELTSGTSFPRNIRGMSQQEMEKLGFAFGKIEDELFQKVTLPKGWSIQPTDHSMWSDVVDAKGNKRGSIFYKAAFYDRDAFASMTKGE
jgi:hypothetical protein